MVADGECRLVGGTPEGELAHDGSALLDNLPRQIEVLLRVEFVERRADHADRKAVRVERPSVGLAVDAHGKPRDNPPARLREVAREATRHLPPVGCRPPCADEGDERLAQRGDVALHVKGERRLGRRLEAGRIPLVQKREDLNATRTRPRLLHLDIHRVTRARHLVGIFLPRRHGRAVLLDEPRQRRGPHVRRQMEREIGLTLGHDFWYTIRTFRQGPIVYRLGHELFMLGRGVRLSLGLPPPPHPCCAFRIAWLTASILSPKSSKPTSDE